MLLVKSEPIFFSYVARSVLKPVVAGPVGGPSFRWRFSLESSILLSDVDKAPKYAARITRNSI